MELNKFLESSGMSKAGLAEFLKVSRSAVTQWKEIPEKHMEKCEAYLTNHSRVEAVVNILTDQEKKRIKDRTESGIDLSKYGSGSKWDRAYSASKIEHYRKMIKECGGVKGAKEWLGPIQVTEDFLQDVWDNKVEPA